MNELIQIEAHDIEAVFTAGKLDALLAEIAEKARAVPGDISTDAGRKQVASTAYKVARSKTQLDAAGKELVSDAKKRIKAIDDERKRARDFLEDLQAEIRKPLTDYENAENRRLQEHAHAMAEIRRLAISSPSLDACEAQLNTLENRDWQEFADEARGLIAETRENIAARAEILKKRVEEKAELERLRAEKAAQDAELERLRAIERERMAKDQAEWNRKKAEEDAVSFVAQTPFASGSPRLQPETHIEAEPDNSRRTFRQTVCTAFIENGISPSNASKVTNLIFEWKIPFVKVEVK